MKNYRKALFFCLWLTAVCHFDAFSQISDTARFAYSNSLMSIYSPDDANLDLRIQSGSNKNLRFVKIFDIIGKEIASFDVSSSGVSQYRVDISGNKQNLFICNLYSDRGLVESKKFFRGRNF